MRLEEADLHWVAACFDDTEDCVENLGLTPGQQTDVRTQVFVNGTQAGMWVALKHWRNRNPVESTFRALLLILLSLHKVDVAFQVCKREFVDFSRLCQCTKSHYPQIFKRVAIESL